MDTNRDKLIELYRKRHVAYKETFSSDNGKEVIKDLEEVCYVKRSTVSTTNVIDPYVLAFREGQRSIMLRIQNMMSEDQLKQIGVEDASRT